jgi:hypothetical protein
MRRHATCVRCSDDSARQRWMLACQAVMPSSKQHQGGNDKVQPVISHK